LINAASRVDGIGLSRRKGRRIAILGDMLELGPTETALHEAIADTPGLAAIDIIHCVGPRMRALYARLPRQPARRMGRTARPTWCPRPPPDRRGRYRAGQGVEGHQGVASG
jgi:UDP-N-acetylmuramoyl-tripeptide--D-alanyl-D-alanine ligase